MHLRLAAAAGDEPILRRELAPVHTGDAVAVLGTMFGVVRRSHAAVSSLDVMRAVARGALAAMRMLERHARTRGDLVARATTLG